MRHIDLIPRPRLVEELPGTLDLSSGGIVVAPPELALQAELAAEWMTKALALRGHGGARFVATAPQAASASPTRATSGLASAPAIVCSLRLVGSFGGEEHRILIGQQGIEIDAASAEGAARAAATIRQLVLSEGQALPCLRIDDAPRFEWRGAMLDCARNFFSVDFVERFIDLMALHKLNRFHWHLTDDQAWRLEIASHPEIAALGSRRRDWRYPSWVRYKEGSYSHADVKRVVAYAARRGIVVIPEIETPGHALALLASHPELSCAGAPSGGGPFLPEDRYGIFEDVLCAGNDASFELLADVFDEVAGLFPGPWVHAGGDEVLKQRWSACPRCRGRMEAEGLRDAGGGLDPEKLQLWFMGRVAELLTERGKTMIGWDEILEGAGHDARDKVAAGHGPAVSGAPRLRDDAIVMSWRGREGGIAAAKAGYRAVMSPQTKACYLDHKHLDSEEEPGNIGVCTVENSYAFDPMPPELSEAEGRLILGGQANIWTEYMYFARNVEYMAFPRLCALAERFWSPAAVRDFDDFARRLETHAGRLDLLSVARYRGALR